jgi:hypothetical protein
VQTAEETFDVNAWQMCARRKEVFHSQTQNKENVLLKTKGYLVRENRHAAALILQWGELLPEWLCKIPQIVDENVPLRCVPSLGYARRKRLGVYDLFSHDKINSHVPGLG